MIEQIRAELNNPADLFYDTLDNGYMQMEVIYFPSLCDQALIKNGLTVPYSYWFNPEEFDRILNANPAFGKADQSELDAIVTQMHCPLPN